MVDNIILMRFKNFQGTNGYNAKINEIQLNPKEIDNIIDNKDKRQFFHEWTDYKTIIKPFYDTDMKFRNKDEFYRHFKHIETQSMNILTVLYPDGEIAISKSHGWKKNKKGDEIKRYYALSYHFIVNGYETDIPFLKKFNLQNKLLDLKYEDDDYEPYEPLDNKLFDNSVYRNGGNMRMIYSYKPSNPDEPDKRQLVPHNLKEDYTKHIIQSNDYTNKKPLILSEVSPPVSPVSSEEEEKEVFGVLPKQNGEVPTLKELKNTLFLINSKYEYDDWHKVGLSLSNIAKSSKSDIYIESARIYFHEWSKLDPSGNYDEIECDKMWRCWIKKVNIKNSLNYGSLLLWARERDMPIEDMDMEQIFKKAVWKDLDPENDAPNIKNGIDDMLNEMNNRLMYVRETSDFIALDIRKKYIYGVDEFNESIILRVEDVDCWSIKSAAGKLADHFSKHRFI